LKRKHKTGIAVISCAVLLAVALIAGTALASGGGERAQSRERTDQECDDTCDPIQRRSMDGNQAADQLRDGSCDAQDVPAAAGQGQDASAEQERDRSRLQDETCDNPCSAQSSEEVGDQTREQSREETREQAQQKNREQTRDQTQKRDESCEPEGTT